MRKLIISALFCIFFAGVSLFSQSEPSKGGIIDISSFEKRFKVIDESMNYLKTKNIEYNDIITMYTEAESLLREMKYTSELKDPDMALRFLSNKLSILEQKTLERVSLAKRMDFMYILMVALGILIIGIMSYYSIYMYSRRK